MLNFKYLKRKLWKNKKPLLCPRGHADRVLSFVTAAFFLLCPENEIIEIPLLFLILTYLGD